MHYHNVSMDEASPQSSWTQMWILFCWCDSDIPDSLPSLIQQLVYWVHSRMVGSNWIPGVHRNTVFLQAPNKDSVCGCISFFISAVTQISWVQINKLMSLKLWRFLQLASCLLKQQLLQYQVIYRLDMVYTINPICSWVKKDMKEHTAAIS
jgi:hypothetical protein